jgi:luciferase family oxidoreductase group 1
MDIAMSFPVSFLDLTPIESQSTAGEALKQSVELAQLADQLGYFRYWFAEHHNTSGLASAAPEIMIEHIASRTTHLRVGSGGVMLPNHSPLKIIETFKLLEALHPGRVDLGLGRAPGTDQITAYAMRRSREAMMADDYPQQVAELIAYDDQSFPANHTFRSIKAIPVDVRMPPLWLLGSSDFSGLLAAEMGLGFAFAAHINRKAAVPAIQSYRERFQPSSRYSEPRSILTVSVTVGETSEHGAQLAKINDLVILRLRSGKLGRYPTLDEAVNYPFTDQERAMIAAMPINYLAGDAGQVHAKIMEMMDATRADELMITTMLPAPEDRRRALVELARELGVSERAGITPFAAASR